MSTTQVQYKSLLNTTTLDAIESINVESLGVTSDLTLTGADVIDFPFDNSTIVKDVVDDLYKVPPGGITDTQLNSVRLDTAEADIILLEGRMDTAEADIIALDGRMDAVEVGKIDKVSSTDEAIVRFNGSNGDVQNSTVYITDIGDIQTAGTVYTGNISGMWSTTTVTIYSLIGIILEGALTYIKNGMKVDTIDEWNPNVGVTVETVLIKDGLVDGRDVSADGTQLDTNTSNITTNTINIATNTSNISTLQSFKTAIDKLTTKGDILSFDTNYNRLAVGSNNQVLTADSTQALGIKWATPATYGDVSSSVSLSVDGEIPVYDSTTGKVIKRGGIKIVSDVVSTLTTNGFMCFRANGTGYIQFQASDYTNLLLLSSTGLTSSVSFTGRSIYTSSNNTYNIGATDGYYLNGYISTLYSSVIDHASGTIMKYGGNNRISTTLAGVTITATTIPSATNTYNIGGSSNYWSNGYITTLNSTTGNITTVSSTTVNASTVGSSSGDLTIKRAGTNKLLFQNISILAYDNILPSPTSTYSLGFSTNRWSDLYVNYINTPKFNVGGDTIYTTATPIEALIDGTSKDFYNSSANSSWIALLAGISGSYKMVLGTLSGYPTVGGHNSDLTAWSTMQVAHPLNIYPSDKRLKKNIKDTTVDALSIIKQIKLKSFDWGAGVGVVQEKKNKFEPLGIIADDLELIMPEQVMEFDTGFGETVKAVKNGFGDSSYLLLLKAIQEQQSIIESLTARIEALEKKNLNV